MSEEDTLEQALRRRYESSGMFRFLAITIHRISKEDCQLTILARPDLHNSLGLVHGGILTTLADAAAVAAVVAKNGPTTMARTIKAGMDFVHSTKTGMVTASGHVVYQSGQLALAEADVTDESGRLLAKGSFLYLVKHSI